MHRQGSLVVQSSPAQQIPLHYQRVAFSEGMICIRGKMHIMRWDQIMALWKDITTDSKGRVSHSYTLHLTDGVTWTFTGDLVNVEELGAILEDEVTNHLLPHVLAAY